MDSKTIYSRKAEAYARYRWSYSPQAIQAIFRSTGLAPVPAAADIGAGTGILARQIADKADRLYLIEPNAPMLVQARRSLSGFYNCVFLQACAEATSLPNHSIDLITIAQAIHWFDPVPACHEFCRILKPGGWLAVLRNYPTDPERGQAIDSIFTPANGVVLPEAPLTPAPPPVSYYYAPGQFQVYTFPFEFKVDWETFLGSLVSISFTPDESHPLFPQFVESARGVFKRFNHGGQVTVRGATELYIGQVDGTTG